jgi:hypothetical protein
MPVAPSPLTSFTSSISTAIMVFPFGVHFVEQTDLTGRGIAMF